MKALLNFVKKLRVSTFIFLLVIPGIVYLFINAQDYQNAFEFIVPGIWMTVFVAVGAYLTSALLGLVLAGLLSLKKGEHTLLYFGVVALVLTSVSAYFFTRSPERYELVGDLSGRVAIINNTPQRVTNLVRFGRYEGGQESNVRSALNSAEALELLGDGSVSAAFIPAERAPDDLPVLWTTAFLADAAWLPAILFMIFAISTLLLVLGSLQSDLHPLAVFAELYIDLVRGIPMIVIILFVGFVLAKAVADSLGIRLNQYTRGVAALSIGYSAYMAEIFRAGIGAVPTGQREAARSLGLSPWQTAFYVVLPQAVKIVIPPLGNEFIAMLKDTALLSIISVRELTQRTREFQSNTFILFPTFNTVAIIYIVMTLAASNLVSWAERRTDTTKR